jgi:16S rRNA (uracil1498-N3)-methyltransferase
MNSNNHKAPRLFLNLPLAESLLPLDEQQAHYLRRVLRLKPGDAIVVFNGAGEERLAVVQTLTRHKAALATGESLEVLPESPLNLTLIQSLVKADAMDLIVQKATELGVSSIIPVTTDFSVVRLDSERASRRMIHWQRIARSACEQSGRHQPPVIHGPVSLSGCLAGLPDRTTKFVLHPGSAQSLEAAANASPDETRVAILIGPEGGLSSADRKLAATAGFLAVTLGTRTLRTETAALVACSFAQLYWGDLSN